MHRRLAFALDPIIDLIGGTPKDIQRIASPQDLAAFRHWARTLLRRQKLTPSQLKVIYLLCDPRQVPHPFYVGYGTPARLACHLREPNPMDASNIDLYERLHQLHQAHQKPTILIVHHRLVHDLKEERALKRKESLIIRHYGRQIDGGILVNRHQ